MPCVVAIPEDVVRTHDDAARATGAQTGRDDLVVEVLPLELLGRHGDESVIDDTGMMLAVASRSSA